jgi:transposase
VDVVGPERRRRWTPAEKVRMVEETYEPGTSVSYVARRNGVAPNQLFRWRRLHRDGALTSVGSGEQVVPATELAQAQKQIRELQRLLGKKTLETEILKEAVEVGQRKKYISRSPLLPPDDSR